MCRVVDIPKTLEPLPVRPKMVPFMYVSLGIQAFCSIFTWLLVAMTALVIYQNITERGRSPHNVVVISYLTIVTHAYTFCILVPFPPIGLIPAVLAGFNVNIVPFVVGLIYVALRASYMAAWTVVDKAVVGLLVSGHVSQMLVIAFARWYLNLRLYTAWLDTYAPEWTPNTTDRWLIWMTRILRVILR